MNDLIEKLGLLPLESVPTGPFRLPLYDPDGVEELEQQRNELLEALIKSVESEIDYEASGDGGSWDVFECEPTKTSIAVIQKATGKSREEILEVLNE